MAKTIGRCVLYCLVFSCFSAPIFAADVNLQMEDLPDQIQFWVENNTIEDIPVKSFKRGVSTLVLLFSAKGILFPFREWLDTTKRNINCGSYKLLYSKNKLPKTSAFILKKDLQQFDMDPMKTGSDFVSGKLFMFGWLNLLRDKLPPFNMGFYVLEIQNKKIISCSPLKETIISPSLKNLAEKEYEKVLCEEKFTN